MKKFLKFIFVVFLLLIILLPTALYFGLKSNKVVQNYILPQLRENLDLDIKADFLSVDLVKGVTANNLILDVGTVIKADKIFAGFFISPYWGEGLELSKLSADKLVVKVGKSKEEKKSKKEEKSSSVFPISIKDLNLTNSQILLDNTEGKFLEISNITLKSPKFTLGSKSKFSLKGNVNMPTICQGLELKGINFDGELDLTYEYFPKLIHGKIEALSGRCKDLNEISLKSDIIISKIETYKLTNTKLTLKDNDKSHQLDLPLVYAPQKFEIALKANELDIPFMQKLGQGYAEAFSSKKETQQEKTEKKESKPFLAVFKADVSKLIYQHYYASNFSTKGEYNSGYLILDEFFLNLGQGEVDFSGFADFVGDRGFDLKLDSSKIDLNEILRDDSSGMKFGFINELSINAKGAGLTPELLEKSSSGEAKFSFENIFIPQYLFEYPPINIIILPFEVVAGLTSSLAEEILPSALIDIINSLTSQLKEGSRLGINNGEILVKLKNGKFELDDSHLHTNALPNIKFDGDIYANGKLDITIFLNMLALNFPLPVSGTINEPEPDIINFIPELIKGLGLSITGVVEGVGEGVQSVGEGIVDLVD